LPNFCPGTGASLSATSPPQPDDPGSSPDGYPLPGVKP
jgi:hypothetical protein